MRPRESGLNKENGLEHVRWFAVAEVNVLRKLFNPLLNVVNKGILGLILISLRLG